MGEHAVEGCERAKCLAVPPNGRLFSLLMPFVSFPMFFDHDFKPSGFASKAQPTFKPSDYDGHIQLQKMLGVTWFWVAIF